MTLYNFEWVIEGVLAKCSKPCCESDVDKLLEKGIGALISLERTNDPTYRYLDTRGIPYHVLEIESDNNDDIIEPGERELEAAIDFFRSQSALGRTVLVHCSAGIKRSRYVAWILKRSISPT